MVESVKSGKYVSSLIKETLFVMSPDYFTKEAIKFINNCVFKVYDENLEVIKQNPVEQLQASIVIYSNERKEIWRYGDCRYMIDGILVLVYKKIDELLSEVRSVYCDYLIEEGKSYDSIMGNDVSREVFIPLLKNREYYQIKIINMDSLL